MAAMTLNSVKFGAAKAAKFDYVGLKPVKVHQNVTSVRPHSVKFAPRILTGSGRVKRVGKSDAECETAVVAGIVPEAPPVPPKPAAPDGTPVATLPLGKRPRRNHRSPVLRAAFQVTSISPANLVYPLFIHEGEEDTPIGAMPGCYRLGWRHGLVEEVAKARDVGVNSIVLFPKVPDALKTETGDEAYNDNGLVPRTIRLLKDKYPDLVIYTDVALDPYSSDGHDGIVREDIHSTSTRIRGSSIPSGFINHKFRIRIQLGEMSIPSGTEHQSVPLC
ncbi:Delta-aminolevulinic acid dehydratase 1, chloroplastic [Orobanche gracilis]